MALAGLGSAYVAPLVHPAVIGRDNPVLIDLRRKNSDLQGFTVEREKDAEGRLAFYRRQNWSENGFKLWADTNVRGTAGWILNDLGPADLKHVTCLLYTSKKAKAEQPAPVVELPPSAPVAAMPLLPPPPPPAPTALDLKLDSQAAAYTSDKAQVGTLFYAIGKAYKVNINVEQGIPDTYQEHFNGGTLRELIQGIVNANDLYTEQVDGTLYVKKTKVAFYSVDFPNIKRESSSETSVSLDPPVNNGTTTNNNVGGVLGAQTTTQTNQAGNQSNGGGGTTSFEVTEKSGDGPWAALKDEIQTQAVAGEKISINPSIGRIMVSSTVQRQELWKQYFDDWNQRMNYQVAVEITLHELQLNDAFSLGVDWTQVQTAISAGGGTSASFSTNTAFSSISGTALPASTLLGNFSTGKIAAAVKALQEQGTMKLVCLLYTSRCV